LQAIRFDKTKFTVAQAKKWVKDHDHKCILFEPAKKEETVQKLKVFHAEIKERLSIDKRLGKIVGYASTRDLDRGNDIVKPSAFEKAMDIFMKNPIVLYMHNIYQPIGKIVDTTINSKGLKIEAHIQKSAKDEMGDNIWEKIELGILKSFSIGYKCIKDFIDDKTNVRTLEELALLEISVVSLPMNVNALFSLAKSFNDGTDLIRLGDYPQPILEKKDNKEEDDANGEVKKLEKEEKDKKIVEDEAQQLIDNQKIIKANLAFQRTMDDLEGIKSKLIEPKEAERRLSETIKTELAKE